MKVAIFDMMDYERPLFNKYSNSELELIGDSAMLTMDNVAGTVSCDAVSVNSHSRLDRGILVCLKENGVRYISTRTVGYEHIDIDSATEMGIRVFSSNVATSNVAEFTVMMFLCLLRRMNVLSEKMICSDFSLNGICGRELRTCAVGIIGTGRIGSNVIRILSGFGCKIYAYDMSPVHEMTGLCEYVSLDILLRKSDIISLHIPLSPETHHMLDYDAFLLMKEGVMIVNTSRGALIDAKDLLRAMEDNIVRYAALDVLHGDEQYVHCDDKKKTCEDYNILHSMIENNRLIYTPHCAFYTQEAIGDIFCESLDFARPSINDASC